MILLVWAKSRAGALRIESLSLRLLRDGHEPFHRLAKLHRPALVGLVRIVILLHLAIYTISYYPVEGSADRHFLPRLDLYKQRLASTPAHAHDRSATGNHHPPLL